MAVPAAPVTTPETAAPGQSTTAPAESQETGSAPPPRGTYTNTASHAALPTPNPSAPQPGSHALEMAQNQLFDFSTVVNNIISNCPDCILAQIVNKDDISQPGAPKKEVSAEDDDGSGQTTQGNKKTDKSAAPKSMLPNLTSNPGVKQFAKEHGQEPETVAQAIQNVLKGKLTPGVVTMLQTALAAQPQGQTLAPDNPQFKEVLQTVLTNLLQSCTFSPPQTKEQISDSVSRLLENPDDPGIPKGVKQAAQALIPAIKAAIMSEIKPAGDSVSTVGTSEVQSTAAIDPKMLAMAKGAVGVMEEKLGHAEAVVAKMPEGPEKMVYVDYLTMLSAAVNTLKDAINDMSSAETDLSKRASFVKMHTALDNLDKQKAEINEQARLQAKEGESKFAALGGPLSEMMDGITKAVTICMAVVIGTMLGVPLGPAFVMFAMKFMEQKNDNSLMGDVLKGLNKGLAEATGGVSQAAEGATQVLDTVTGGLSDKMGLDSAIKSQVGMLTGNLSIDSALDLVPGLGGIGEIGIKKGLSEATGGLTSKQVNVTDYASPETVYGAVGELIATVIPEKHLAAAIAMGINSYVSVLMTCGNPMAMMSLPSQANGPIDIMLEAEGAYGDPPDPAKKAIAMATIGAAVQVIMMAAMLIGSGGTAGAAVAAEATGTAAEIGAAAAKGAASAAEVATTSAEAAGTVAKTTNTVAEAASTAERVMSTVEKAGDAINKAVQSAVKTLSKMDPKVVKAIQLTSSLTQGAMQIEQGVVTIKNDELKIDISKSLARMKMQQEETKAVLELLMQMINKLIDGVNANPDFLLQLDTFQGEKFTKAAQTAEWPG